MVTVSVTIHSVHIMLLYKCGNRICYHHFTYILKDFFDIYLVTNGFFMFNYLHNTIILFVFSCNFMMLFLHPKKLKIFHWKLFCLTMFMIIKKLLYNQMMILRILPVWLIFQKQFLDRYTRLMWLKSLHNNWNH